MSTFKITLATADRITSNGGILDSQSNALKAGFDVQGSSWLRIMSGPIPTQEELELAYETWDRFTGSPTEILVEYSIAGGASVTHSNEFFTLLMRPSVVATSTGTASWFIWNGNPTFQPFDRGDAPGAPDGTYLPCIVGTITEIGGSPIGDMQLASLDVVAGQRYDMGTLTLEIPRVYTW